MPISFFESELSKLTETKVLAMEVLKRAPPYFMEAAASSSGKYHPEFANTHMGLAKHTKAAFYIAEKLCEVYDLTKEETDYTLCAVLLHDICKYGLPGGRHTVSDHDRVGAAFIKKVADSCGITGVFLKPVILAVAFHYGKWSTRDDPTLLRKFPEEYSKVMLVTHVADVISACKEINFSFFMNETLIG